jgi:L(+)-tartrate dehydratase alpha subunit
MIRSRTLYDAALDLHARVSVEIPSDVRARVREMYETESHARARYVLGKILENYDAAARERRPMCSDTGLPRFYVKCGNEAGIEGGFVALERALRRATADATSRVPLRPNRVDPLTRRDYDNNVGAHAPEVAYSFEPDASWVDLTVVHKGGLFGGDARMLFPADGVPGIRRFYLDVISEFLRRGMACQPVTIGIGLGGSKDTCVRLAKEAACLRTVNDRHPRSDIAALESELVALGNDVGFGVMGMQGTSAVMDVHIETAFAHTGGMPIAIQQFCFAQRRLTARILPDNAVAVREDPQWFTDYYRREGIE